MTGTRCFFLTPTEHYRVSFRRYEPDVSCAASERYCDQSVLINERARPADPASGPPDAETARDARWPARCGQCGRSFSAQAEQQVRYDRLYRRSDGLPDQPLRPYIPGAMWNADWRVPFDHGKDGRWLVVVCPDGRLWEIDSEASNCTRKGDRTHQCWVRTGEPPLLTVGKGGETCAAGSGSIDTGGYHGFLRDGEFTPA